MTQLAPIIREVAPYLRWLCLGLSVFFIVRMLLTFRRVRGTSRKACVIGMVFPVLMLAVYAWFIGSDLATALLAALFALGVAAGFWQGRKTKVWVASGRAVAQNTIWFLVVWAASFTFIQALVSLGSSMRFNLGIGAICVTTGIAIGSQSNILVRLSLLAPRKIPAG